MEKLIVFLLIGFFAQLLDGSLGMSSGLSSTSILLAIGVAPAMASASIHIAELATTAASGVSHWKFGNVDKRLVKLLIIPGCIGAFVGATLLSVIPGDIVKPYISAVLLLIGFYVLYSFTFGKKIVRPTHGRRSKQVKLKKSFIYPMATVAGFLDSIGGGGWGPVNTPLLISRSGMKARNVIGSVDASEFAVALSSTAGFLLSLGVSNINWDWALALAIGGVIAAPIAAWIVKILPSQLLGVLVGGIIIYASTNTLVTSWEVVPESIHDAIYSSIISLWMFSILFMIWRIRNKKNRERNKS